MNSALLFETQIDVLQDLFESADGLNWNWKVGPDAAPRWSFNASMQQNPCADDSISASIIRTWQGISCNFSPEKCYVDYDLCAITNITLPQYQVSLIFYFNRIESFTSE